MAWDDVLAAVGGGLQGYEGEKKDQEDRAFAERRLESEQQLRQMLETVRQEGQNNRNANTVSGALARTDRTVAGANARNERTVAGANTRAANRIDFGREKLNQDDEHYWNTDNRLWDTLFTNDETRRRGQDVAASTATRGQDLAHEDRQDTLDAGGDARAMTYAMRAYDEELKRRKAANTTFGSVDAAPSFGDWLKTSADPEIFPSVRNMFGTGGDAVPASAPAAGARPPVPVGPRSPAGAAAPPKGLAVGATVKLRNGRVVVVKKINPDGTFEY